MPPTRHHAAVIGASFAGLVTAQVLSKHFARVTLIEKDTVTADAESRPGQLQTQHLHGLLAKGLDILERYFPGLTRELIAHGAIYDDMARAIRWYQFGGYRKQYDSGLMGVVQSRPLLEQLIRKRVLALPNVHLLDQTTVSGWQEDGRVTGVQVQDANGLPRTLTTDLVVDCSGRGSRIPKWLTRSGFEAPVREEVTVRVGYSTRLYERQPGDLKGARLLLSLPAPPRVLRSGYLSPIEGDRWMLTVAGWGGDYPPADEEGLRSFVRSLPISDMYRIIANARPLSDILTYRFKGSQRLAYHKLKRMPAGFLVLGDAAASFNPVYAQGMTSAAMQAEVLDTCLAHSNGHLQHAYFRRIAKVIDIPWQLATGEDFRFSTTVGKKPFGTDLINAYVTHVHRATHANTRVYGEFLKVMNLTQASTSLMKPSVLWQVLRHMHRPSENQVAQAELSRTG